VSSLLHKISRSVFWNALLLPLIAFLNAVLSVLIRRGFGLQSGIYDVLIGLMASVILYSSLGIPNSLTKWVPELQVTRGHAAVASFLRIAFAARLGLLVLILVPLNFGAEPLAGLLGLGSNGVLYIRLVSVLILGRAIFEIAIQGLQAFLAHLSAGLLSLAQAALDPALIALSFVLGYGMGGTFLGLATSATILAVLALIRLAQVFTSSSLEAEIEVLATSQWARGAAPQAGAKTEMEAVEAAGSEAAKPAGPRGDLDGLASRIVKFALFTYAFHLSIYFARPAFASPALAAILGDIGQVALFTTGFQVPAMVVALVVAGFRGVYRPLFSRLRAGGDLEKVRRAYNVVGRVQFFLLIPAGTGLGIMVADYIPLIYTEEFTGAVPVAQVMVVLLFAETAFNLGNIVLSIDEQYGPVLIAQSLRVLSVPLFLWAASHGGILVAASVLGLARLLSAVLATLIARAKYGVTLPWRFALKVAGVSLVMGLVLITGRAFWSTSPLQATTLTFAGAAVFLVGIRLGHLLGADEIDILRRSRLPGHELLVRWLAPAGS
jgi:O-antigen/teichoic acid export membrane protein